MYVCGVLKRLRMCLTHKLDASHSAGCVIIGVLAHITLIRQLQSNNKARTANVRDHQIFAEQLVNGYHQITHISTFTLSAYVKNIHMQIRFVEHTRNVSEWFLKISVYPTLAFDGVLNRVLHTEKCVFARVFWVYSIWSGCSCIHHVMPGWFGKQI